MPDAPVTFLMPVYNGGAHLRPAVESVLAQTRTDWRLLVVDDGSADGSADLVEAYSDPRIEVVRFERNQGQTAALNEGLRRIETEWVARLDQDDIAAPDRIERQLDRAAAEPSLVLLGSWVGYIDEAGDATGDFKTPTDSAGLRRALLDRPQSSPLLHSTAMFKTDVVREVGGYPFDYAYSQDYVLWLMLAARGAIACVPETLVYIRRHASQTSLRPEVALQQLREVLRATRECGPALNLSREERAIWGRGITRLETELALRDVRDRRWKSAAARGGRTLAGIARHPSAVVAVWQVGATTLRYRAGLRRQSTPAF